MKYSELIKLLKKNKIVFSHHGKNHDIWFSPITNRQVPLPRHRKEVPIGTLNSILKDAGIHL